MYITTYISYTYTAVIIRIGPRKKRITFFWSELNLIQFSPWPTPSAIADPCITLALIKIGQL